MIEKIGYNQRDGFKKAKVHTAIGEEHGYWLRVAELTVLGVTTPNFALTVFPLGHKDIDGLVGMNFLRHFNFEVRPADRQILVELVSRAKDPGVTHQRTRWRLGGGMRPTSLRRNATGSSTRWVRPSGHGRLSW